MPKTTRRPLKLVLTADEAAERLGISKSRLLERTRKGLLEVIKVSVPVTGHPGLSTIRNAYPADQFPEATPGGLVDAGEVAYELNVNKRSVNNWARDGYIDGFQLIDGEWRFPVSEITRLKRLRKGRQRRPRQL